MKLPRIVIAGASSGVGKTTITCSIIQGLIRRGLRVSAFKAGPDYIDPAYLGAAAGRDAHNLDEWVMGSISRMHERFVHHTCDDTDVAVIEGVMGYYDGIMGGGDHVSTYSVASVTRTPVILVIDASKAARSVAAVATGFVKFQNNSSRIIGVILNRLAGTRHMYMCTDALSETGIPVLGCILRDTSLQLKERHLGLHSTIDPKVLAGSLKNIADAVLPQLDMDRIWQAACSAGAAPRPATPHRPSSRGILGNRIEYNSSKSVRKSGGKGPVIGVALDQSFNFYYRDNLDALTREGARLVFFSPVSDRQLPPCDGLYIGGGFPEVLGAKLERNAQMRRAVKQMAQDGAPVYAECGGLMYLSRAVTDDKTGRTYKMAGVIDGVAVMTGSLVLNYTAGMIDSHTPITGIKPRMFKGHEFHYSEMRDVPRDVNFTMVSNTYQAPGGDADYPDSMEGIRGGLDGILQDNTLATYGHLYFDMANFAAHFVANCANYKRR